MSTMQQDEPTESTDDLILAAIEPQPIAGPSSVTAAPAAAPKRVVKSKPKVGLITLTT